METFKFRIVDTVVEDCYSAGSFAEHG